LILSCLCQEEISETAVAMRSTLGFQSFRLKIDDFPPPDQEEFTKRLGSKFPGYAALELYRRAALDAGFVRIRHQLAKAGSGDSSGTGARRSLNNTEKASGEAA
jgi:hypothetical protein